MEHVLAAIPAAVAQCSQPTDLWFLWRQRAPGLHERSSFASVSIAAGLSQTAQELWYVRAAARVCVWVLEWDGLHSCRTTSHVCYQPVSGGVAGALATLRARSRESFDKKPQSRSSLQESVLVQRVSMLTAVVAFLVRPCSTLLKTLSCFGRHLCFVGLRC